jgi:RNA polymerase sigma-70 factor (ECF subfamily)
VPGGGARVTEPAGDGGRDLFFTERPRLLGLAYRICGSLADAEDIVQEAWLKWAAADQAGIDRPAAWLTTVTSRLALDRLRSSARRKEAYVGPWLPEPVLTAPGPDEAAETAETLTLAFLTMLDRLDPLSRVVFLLTDVFAYSSDEVSRAVAKTPAACRQIASRARRKVRGARPAHPSADDRAIADQLLAALSAGDMDAAIALMSKDVVLVTDGGPNRRAARHPVVGPQRVARFLVNVAKRLPPGTEVHPATVNAAAGFFLRDASGQPDGVIACDLTDGLVSAIWVVNNRDKLRHLDTPVVLA